MDKRETIHKLVEENKLREACIELKKIISNGNDLNSLIILLSRLSEVNEIEIRGTANFQNINIEKNKIRSSILGLTEKIYEDSKNNNSEKFPIQSKDDIIEGLKNEIKKLKEDYKNSINHLEPHILEYLADKYKYGFIVFGIFDGKFIYTPNKKIMNSAIEADWRKTNISIDSNSNSYILNIRNLKWTFSVENRSTTTTKADNLTCLLPISPKERVSYNLRVVGMFYQPKLYFEMLKNSDKNNVYVLGFKLKDLNEI